MNALTLWTIPFILIGLPVSAYLWWSLFKTRKLAKIILYEKVGDKEILSDEPLRELLIKKGNDHTFLKISGEDKGYIDQPKPEDYYNSKKWGKVIHITKYSDDDYRIKKRFDDQYFKEKLIPEVEEVENELGEVIKQPKLDDNGLPIMITVREHYSEPLGIDQDGRDAIRVGMENELLLRKEMEGQGFWEKYGQTIFNVVSLMIIALVIMKTSGDVKDSNIAASDICSSAADRVEEKVDDPLFAEKLYNTFVKREAQANAPPS